MVQTALLSKSTTVSHWFFRLAAVLALYGAFAAPS